MEEHISPEAAKDYVSNAAYVDAAARQACAIRRRGVIDMGITAALALWERYASESVSNLQNETAKESMAIARDIQDHADKFYPYEKNLVDEVFSEGRHRPAYIASALDYGGNARREFNNSRGLWRRFMRDRCRAVSRCYDARWLRNAGLAETDITSFALRQAEARARALNDRRYARQYAALNLGKGILSNIATYMQLKGQAGAVMGEMLTGTINSIGQAVGYMANRERPAVWKDTPFFVMPPPEFRQKPPPPSVPEQQRGSYVYDESNIDSFVVGKEGRPLRDALRESEKPRNR